MDLIDTDQRVLSDNDAEEVQRWTSTCPQIPRIQMLLLPDLPPDFERALGVGPPTLNGEPEALGSQLNHHKAEGKCSQCVVGFPPPADLYAMLCATASVDHPQPCD
ncbi:hypothetical protein HanIR_Chr01g0010381 [Helianthus annuus]|nr:hypothetical protein HanIR_Chr01g0010381 [Helianthus annuus]